MNQYAHNKYSAQHRPAHLRLSTARRVYSEAHTAAAAARSCSGLATGTPTTLSYSPAADMPARSSTLALERTASRPWPLKTEEICRGGRGRRSGGKREGDARLTSSGYNSAKNQAKRQSPLTMLKIHGPAPLPLACGHRPGPAPLPPLLHTHTHTCSSSAPGRLSPATRACMRAQAWSSPPPPLSYTHTHLLQQRPR